MNLKKYFSHPAAWGAAIGTLVIVGTLMAMSEARAETVPNITNSTSKLYFNGSPVCSGTWVNYEEEDYFVTAKHCIRQGNDGFTISDFVYDSDHITPLKMITYPLEVLGVSSDVLGSDHAAADVAVFDTKMDVDREHSVELGDKSLHNMLSPGDNMIAAGYPRGDTYQITDGMFSGYIPDPIGDYDGPVYKTTLETYPGNSGGGIYVERNGDWEYIGLAMASGYPNMDTWNVVTPLPAVYDLLEHVHNENN